MKRKDDPKHGRKRSGPSKRVEVRKPMTKKGPESQSAPRESSNNNEKGMSNVVISIMNKLEVAKEERRQEDVREKLDIIHERIELSLRSAGYSTTLIQDEESTKATFNRPPTFDLKQRRQAMGHQKNMLEMINNYIETLSARKHILDDVGDWLSSVQDLEEGVKTYDEIEELETEYARMGDEIVAGLDYAELMTQRIKEIGYILLEEAGLLESGEEDTTESLKPSHLPALRSKAPGKPLIDDSAILTNSENYSSACAEVYQTLEAAVKAVRKNQDKNAVRHGIKQWKLLVKAMDTRISEYQDLKEERLQLKTNTEQLTRTNELFKRDYDKMKMKADALDSKVLKLQAQLSELQSTNDSIKAQLNDMVDAHKALLNKPKSVVRIVEEPTVIIDAKSSSKRLAESQSLINAATKPLQEEIELFKGKVTSADKEIATLKKKLSEEQEKNDKLKAKIYMNKALDSERGSFDSKMEEEKKLQMQSLHDTNETMKEQIEKLSSELQDKNEQIQYQEMRIKNMTEDLRLVNFEEVGEKGQKSGKVGTGMTAETKRMVFRMKKDFDTEMARMKNHVKKDRARNEAAMRKLEQSHRDQMLSIHKSSVHLLRAINRFKEAVACILDREDLPTAANDVRRIANLPTDENPTDSRQMLAQMAGSAVEILVTVEFKLSQSLMNKRLEIKDNSIARNFANKDLEFQIEASKKAKETSEFLAGKLKEVTGKLAVAEESLSQFVKFEGKRYGKVAERYRRITAQYLSMKGDMEKMHQEHIDIIKKKDKVLKSVIGQRDSLQNVLEEHRVVISTMQHHIHKHQSERHKELRLSVEDMRENLHLLEEAMEENKINKDIYDMSIEVVKRSMEIPLIRLRFLMERYIVYRRLQETRAHLARQLRIPLAEERQREILTFLQRMDRRLEATSKAWLEERQMLDTQRREMMEKMGVMFGDLVIETGIVFIQPECKSIRLRRAEDAKSTSTGNTIETTGTSRSTSRSTRSTLPRIQVSKPAKPMVSDLVGKRIPLLSPGEDTTWSLPGHSPPVSPTILDTPLLLDLDINQRMRAAQKALRRVKRRQSYPISKAEGVDYTLGRASTLAVALNVKNNGPGDTCSSVGVPSVAKKTEPPTKQACKDETNILAQDIDHGKVKHEASTV